MPRPCHSTIYHDIQKYIHFSINIARNQFRLMVGVYAKCKAKPSIWAERSVTVCPLLADPNDSEGKTRNAEEFWGEP